MKKFTFVVLMKLKQKQEKILEAAIELFKERGFVGASMRDLAARLDIKAASLYAHIHSKDELLEWICFSVAEKFFDGLKEVMEAQISVEEKLDLFIEKHLSIVLENPDVTNIYSNEWKHLDTSLDRFILLRKEYQKKVETLMDEFFTALGKPLDSSRFTSRFLLHTLNNSYYWYKLGEKGTKEMIEEIKDKVLYGLVGRK